MNRKLIIIIIMLSIFSCNNRQQEITHKSEDSFTHNGETIPVNYIRNKLSQYRFSGRFNAASQYLDTLQKENPRSGYLYFERGITDSHSDLPKAIRDMQTAEKLGYSSKVCEMAIKSYKELQEPYSGDKSKKLKQPYSEDEKQI